MSFFDEVNEKMVKKYLIGITLFIVIIIMISGCELLLPKRFKIDKEVTENEEYVVNIEDLNSSRLKLSISGYAFKGSDAIERYNSYYILKNAETGKMYKLKTKMEKRAQFKDTGVEYCGMHSQAILLFMNKGTYDVYVWYDNNDENVLLKTDKQIQI